MNYFDMEANSRQENLIEFKRAYGNFLKAVVRCLDRCCSDWTVRKKEKFFVCVLSVRVWNLSLRSCYGETKVCDGSGGREFCLPLDLRIGS